MISEIQEENEVHDEVLVNYSLSPAHQIRRWILWKLWNTLGLWLLKFFGVGSPKRESYSFS